MVDSKIRWRIVLMIKPEFCRKLILLGIDVGLFILLPSIFHRGKRVYPTIATSKVKTLSLFLTFSKKRLTPNF